MSAEMFPISPHESKEYCFVSLKGKIQNIEIIPTESFQFGNALESYFPLLEAVFEYLDYNDLKTCTLVSETWKELATKVLLKRDFVSWVSSIHPTKVLKSSKNFNYSNISHCILFYDYHYLKLNKYICLHEKDFKKMTFVEYVAKEIVPDNIDHCLLSCSSVTPVCIKELVKEKDDNKTPRAVFQSISLPKIPDVNISMFHCNPAQSDIVNNTLSKHINPDEVVKCLLIFTINNPYKYIENFLSNVLKGQNANSLALGGGIIKGTKTFLDLSNQKTFTAKDYFCITFQHNKWNEVAFNASSIVVPNNVHANGEFEDYLESLKLKSKNRSNGVAFRICCAAKYDKDKETELFNKHFPKIPIFGIDVDGEVGWNTCDLNTTEFVTENGELGNKKFKSTFPEVLHQWSSIFVLVTWGKTINDGNFNS